MSADTGALVAYGAQAVLHGTPDFRHSDTRTNLVDALANICHYAQSVGIDAGEVFTEAMTRCAVEAAGPENDGN